MPELSRFYGIVIRMYYNDYAKHHQPHFHALYGGYEATFIIDPLALLAGAMSGRQLNLIVAWAELHGGELLENWRLARSQELLMPIDSLR